MALAECAGLDYQLVGFAGRVLDGRLHDDTGRPHVGFDNAAELAHVVVVAQLAPACTKLVEVTAQLALTGLSKRGADINKANHDISRCARNTQEQTLLRRPN